MDKAIIPIEFNNEIDDVKKNENEFKSAQPVLDQLTNILIQLEDNLFPNP